MIVFVYALVPGTSLIGHLCSVAVGYLCKASTPGRCMSVALLGLLTFSPLTVGLGYLRFLAPPEKPLRWVESKLNLLAIVPHYVSVDQKTYGRFGVLPSASPSGTAPINLAGSTQRLGP